MSEECNEHGSSTTTAVGNALPETSNGFLEKELPSEGCSPAPSNCSFISEQEVHEGNFIHRQSPFLNLSQASPSAFSSFHRPDFLNNSIADSETSSRSSLDGSFLSKESSSEGMEKFRAQRSTRKLSSSSSDSDGSELTVGGGSIDGDEPVVRKLSKNKMAESNLPVARRLDAPRGRIANIRRESDCSLNNEVEHERLVKTSQQVSCGFDDITLESSSASEMRRRAPSASSVGEPISIVTNVFLPHSCSPSPTRVSEIHKQCYSPSTHQMVRPNMPYSATPSPTQSPTRQRLLRSISPITTKSAMKRRYTAGVDEVEAKRSCGSSGVPAVFVRNSTSPLVTDRSFPYTSTVPQEFAQPTSISINWASSSSTGARRLSSMESITDRRSSDDSAMEERKNAVEIAPCNTQAEGLPSEGDVQQSDDTGKETASSESCAMCTDVCTCIRKSSNDEEPQPERRIVCPYEPFLRSD
uniref:RING-type domain-containing protein n=1 Tax=Haemonchus contortus TaxID=6289 RepID=A0A7I5E8G8_HAECO|nr:MGC80520 protein [Haemonchus contortus]